MSFVLAHIEGRDPLRLAFVHLYEPNRVKTPRWIDAWESLDTVDDFRPTLMDLDRFHSTMKKLSVYRPRPLKGDDGSTLYGLRWATIHAQSGVFDEDVEVDDIVSEDDDY